MYAKKCSIYALMLLFYEKEQHELINNNRNDLKCFNKIFNYFENVSKVRLKIIKMKSFILFITILTVIYGRKIYSPGVSDPSWEIFNLHKFIESTEIDIGHIDESVFRIYKDTSLIFPTCEAFNRRSLPSKFSIEFTYNLKFEPSCAWNLIRITDCERKEVFSVNLDPEKSLVTVSFTDQYGNFAQSIFIDYHVSTLYDFIYN